MPLSIDASLGDAEVLEEMVHYRESFPYGILNGFLLHELPPFGGNAVYETLDTVLQKHDEGIQAHDEQ